MRAIYVRSILLLVGLALLAAIELRLPARAGAAAPAPAAALLAPLHSV